MALDPDILFLDEPSGLDPINYRLDSLIIELKESLGITFVVVTHELASIFDIADYSIFLDGKRKLWWIKESQRFRENSKFEEVRAFLHRGIPALESSIANCFILS